MTYPVQKTRNGGTVEVKYIQHHNGVAQAKGTDGVLYPLASFTCNNNFLNLLNAFNLWDSRRDNPIPEVASS